MKKLLLALLLLIGPQLSFSDQDKYTPDSQDMSGQYLSTATAGVGVVTAAQWNDLVSLQSMPAGTWIINAHVVGATTALLASWEVGVSTTSGNNGGGMTLGQNWTISSSSSNFIIGYPAVNTSTTTWYLKARPTGGAGHTVQGHMTAQGTRH